MKLTKNILGARKMSKHNKVIPFWMLGFHSLDNINWLHRDKVNNMLALRSLRTQEVNEIRVYF